MEIESTGIQLGENESQTFCKNLDDSIEIAKTIVAFANTKGGRLVIGLKSNGKIIGILPSDEISKLEKIISTYALSLDISSKIIEIGFRLILIVEIKKSDILPVYFSNESNKKEVYIRNDKRNITANKLLLGTWKYEEKNGNLPEKLSDKEIQIVEIIKLNPNLSLTQIYKRSNLAIDEVDYTLIRLINWQVVEMKITEISSFFNVL